MLVLAQGKGLWALDLEGPLPNTIPSNYNEAK